MKSVRHPVLNVSLSMAIMLKVLNRRGRGMDARPMHKGTIKALMRRNMILYNLHTQRVKISTRGKLVCKLI